MAKGYKAMVDEAMAMIVTLTPQQAAEKLGDPDVVFVDIRDPRELEREGTIPKALHATRGMLEFWIDPESPYHRKVFGEDREFIFFCAGGLRSALATRTALEMGLRRAAHIEGGFGEWKKLGLPVADWAAKVPGEKK